MCTLVFGIDVAGPGTLLAGANRDERPERPTTAPGVLSTTPRVVGGRDRVAGGTWFAICERHAVVAMLNRRPEGASTSDPAVLRSRGLLAIDVATAPAGAPAAFAEQALQHAMDSLAAYRYAAFSLVCLTPGASWVLVHELGAPPRVQRPSPGWHALAHAELDDPQELRTAGLARCLAGWRPANWDAARTGMATWLADHGERAGAPVCVHDGPMPTISSSIVMITPNALHYAHREGRPCEGPFSERPDLLGEARSAQP